MFTDTTKILHAINSGKAIQILRDIGIQPSTIKNFFTRNVTYKAWLSLYLINIYPIFLKKSFTYSNRFMCDTRVINKDQHILYPNTAKSLRKTRMHSSRIRTARLLTISRSIQWGGGRGLPSLPGCRTPLMQTPFDADPP